MIYRIIDTAIWFQAKEKGTGSENIKNYIHIYSGVNKYETVKAGILIAVQRKLQCFIKNLESTAEHIMKVPMKIRGRLIYQ
jgi:hypothetical protein